MDILSFVLGFLSAISLMTVAIFAAGISMYNKKNKSK